MKKRLRKKNAKKREGKEVKPPSVAEQWNSRSSEWRAALIRDCVLPCLLKSKWHQLTRLTIEEAASSLFHVLPCLVMPRVWAVLYFKTWR